MKRHYLLALLCFTFTTSSAVADVLMLTPTADSFVDAVVPDTAFPTGNLEAAMVGAPSTVATELTFMYAQFQLPEGMTGQDIASVNSVNFLVRRSSEDVPQLNLTYYVYAVHDGIDSASANDYTWNDSVGFDETHNEVRFTPQPDEISYYSDPAESAYIGSLDTTSSGPVTRPFGFVNDEFQSQTALQNRKDVFLQDTDGRITFYMKSRANFEVTTLQTFASLENVDLIPAPTLVLDFVPGSGVTPGDYNDDGVVNAADYTVWRDTVGSMTDLRANGDDTGASMGVIDEADYEVWVANFGAGTGSASAAPVPEPASAMFVVLAAWCGAVVTRRSRLSAKPQAVGQAVPDSSREGRVSGTA